MKIDLFGVPDGDNVVEVESEAVKLDIPQDELAFDSPVRVVCKLRKNGDFVNGKGTVTAVLMMQCSCCLDTFCHEIEGKFSLVVRRLKQGESAPELPKGEEKADEDNLIFLEHDAKSIDITEYVRDAVLLSAPLKPICDDRCRGLCPICGYNLNEGECRCEEKREDPRWQSLSGLLQKDDSDK